MIVKVKISDIRKESIKIINNRKELKFRLEKSPFDESEKIVFNLPFNSHKLDIYVGNKKFSLKIKIGGDEVESESELKSFAYAELRFYKTKFLKFIEENKNLDLEDPKFIMSAFSALVDAEGMIEDRKSFIRRIRMNDDCYLKNWKFILEKFGIKSNFGMDDGLYKLEIYGWEDFNRLIENEFKMFHSKKNRKFDKLMKGYKRNQVTRGEGTNFYLNKLIDIKTPVSARELSEITGKSKHVVNHFLLKLGRSRKIEVDKSDVKYLYSAK